MMAMNFGAAAADGKPATLSRGDAGERRGPWRAPSVGLRPVSAARNASTPSPHTPLFHGEGTMKLRLRVDDLRIDAFATTAAASAARGTVRGNESIIWTIQPCPPQTADDTCGMTCGHTCDVPSCNPADTCTCV
jgi:hypothetical protein